MRVVLAEDLAPLRDGLTRILDAYSLQVVEAVADGPSVLPALTRHRPDVAVLDVRLPPTFTDEGLQAALAARTQLPGLPILVLSQHVEQLDARELLADKAGGVGYLLKDRLSNVGQFTDAVAGPQFGGAAVGGTDRAGAGGAGVAGRAIEPCDRRSVHGWSKSPSGGCRLVPPGLAFICPRTG